MVLFKSGAAMDMVVATDGVIAAVAVITTGGAEVAAITMVGDITAITGDCISEAPAQSRGLF
jgi:hypothetical protein